MHPTNTQVPIEAASTGYSEFGLGSRILLAFSSHSGLSIANFRASLIFFSRFGDDFMLKQRYVYLNQK
jgi:hypothetical protein